MFEIKYVFELHIKIVLFKYYKNSNFVPWPEIKSYSNIQFFDIELIVEDKWRCLSRNKIF